MSVQKAKTLEFYSPLHDFQWAGNSFELAPGVLISKKKGILPDHALTKDKKKQLALTDNWLWFNWAEGTAPSASELTNLILLSLRLVKPSRVFAAYRFCEEINHSNVLLEQFSYPTGIPHSVFTDGELKQASIYYQHLNHIYSKQGRLYNALYLMAAGIRSSAWSVRLICHAAALEGLLTYGQEWGLTKRLAKTYACLMAVGKSERDAMYDAFAAAYSARSDIIHGRMHSIMREQRIPALVQIEDITRIVWQKVFSCSQLMTVLEEDDSARKAYFEAVQGNYNRKNC